MLRDHLAPRAADAAQLVELGVHAVAVKPPSRASAGGSSTSVVAMRSRTSAQLVQLREQAPHERRLTLRQHQHHARDGRGGLPQ